MTPLIITLKKLYKRCFNITLPLCFLSVLLNGQALRAGEDFGDPVNYAIKAVTVYATVTINGEAAGVGDVVAAYVGSELRGKSAIQFVVGGVAYASVEVNPFSGDETATFKVYDVSAKAIFQVPDTTATINASTPTVFGVEIKAVGDLPTDTTAPDAPTMAVILPFSSLSRRAS